MRALVYFLLGFFLSFGVIAEANAYTSCVDTTNGYSVLTDFHKTRSVTGNYSNSTPGYRWYSPDELGFVSATGVTFYSGGGVVYHSSCANRLAAGSIDDSYTLYNSDGTQASTEPDHCSNAVKDGDEEGINCGGSCSDDCIKSCPTGEKLFQTSGSSIYYCAVVTDPDINGVCTSGILNASGTECHKIDFSGLVISDQDYIDSTSGSTDSSDNPVSEGTYNYLDSDPATSGTTSTTTTVSNDDGSTTTTKTDTTTKSNGATSTTTTKTTTNTDGSTTVSTTTTNYDANGTMTGTSTSSVTTDASGNSSSQSSSDGDAADGDEVLAGDGAAALDISDDIDLTYGSFGTAWDGFRDELAATTLVASVQAFTNAIPTQSTGPTYTLSFGRYGSHSINTNDYDDQLEIIGYALLIMSSFIGIRIVLTGK